MGFDIFQVLDGRTGDSFSLAELIALPVEYYFISDVRILLEDDRFRLIPGVSAKGVDIPAFRERNGFGWVVRGPGGPLFVRSLTDEQRELPLLEAVPANLVITYLESSWHPRDETRTTLEFTADAVREAKKRGWKGFETVSWFVGSPTGKLTAPKKRKLVEAIRVELGDAIVEIQLSKSVTVITKPPAGTNLRGAWFDRTETAIERLSQELGVELLGHEFG
jgi:hypothetical protein